MSRTLRQGLVALLLFVLAVAAWRVWGQMQAEREAARSPMLGMAWRPAEPLLQLRRAEQALAAGRLDAASDEARSLLAREPLQGEAFRVLAQVAARRQRDDEARRLFRIAERRAPRDLPTRAWLAQDALARGDIDEGLAQIDRVLRISPNPRALLPLLVRMAEDPGFAKALAGVMARDAPPWRPAMLAALRAPKTGSARAEGQVMQALQALGDMSQEDYGRWLDSLMASGRWGEAYARWASRTVSQGGRLPAVYNGDFERPVSNAGFDWRLRRTPGVLVQFEPAPDGRGQAAMLRFLDRRIPSAGLEHALMLPPGSYRLTLGVRGEGLRSPLGLQWAVACVGQGGVVGRSEPLDGSFPWRTLAVPLQIPAGCQAQWLRLVNPVAGGAAQQASGVLWVDNVAVGPAPEPGPAES